MRPRTSSRSITAMLAVVIALTLASSSAVSDTPPAASAEQQAAMQAWQRAVAIGPQHRQLHWFKGRWKERIQTWMHPGQPPRIEQG
ncbi:MAG: hypothetical protein ACYCUL_06980, partial [Metallibacterium scheffleri]